MSGWAWGRLGLRAGVRFLVLAFLLPCVAFALVGSFAPGFRLDRYRYAPDEGYVPLSVVPDGDGEPTVIELVGFYTRFASGALCGEAGRSRASADRSLAGWLLHRALPSVGIVATALGVALLISGVAVAAGWRSDRRPGRRRWLRRVVSPLGVLVDGLPLPFVGMVVFVLLVRLVPRDGALLSPAAMVVWAGVALAAAEAVTGSMARALGDEAGRIRRRPFVLAAQLRGESAASAVRPVLLPMIGSRARGAVLLFCGGLIVVEPALGIDGLGEILRDVVVDRAGTDPLVFAGVLALFALPIALVDALAGLARSLGHGVPR